MDPTQADMCFFCGKITDKLYRSPVGPAICLDCAMESVQVLGEESDFEYQEEDAITLKKLPTPETLKKYLDKYVIGQEKAKKVLSVAVYNHYKKIKYAKELEEQDVDLDKSNILLIGPTGTGKTLLARSLAKKLDVPFAIADATTITEAGYVGEDVENILLKLIQAADDDVEKAEHGIIFLDEVDKIAKKGENVSITRDVSGEGVQQALLKIIEGTVASVPPQGGRKHPGQEMIRIDTSNILFICGGAFVGLDKIIEKRMSSSSIGFGHDIQDKQEKDLETIYSNLLPDDLIKFGLIPEFIGRLPVHVGLNNLSIKDMERIITKPKNSILKQYIATLKIDGVDLVFTKSAISAVAKIAYEQKTGARGIRGIIENVMGDVMYYIPSAKNVKSVTVNDKVILDGEKPVCKDENGNVLNIFPDKE